MLNGEEYPAISDKLTVYVSHTEFEGVDLYSGQKTRVINRM